MTRLARRTLGVAVATLLAGCTGSGDPSSAPTGGGAEARPPVTVERGDITSVLVVTGVAQPSVTFAVPAQRAGDATPTVGKGSDVKAGQVVAKVDGRTATSPVAGTVIATRSGPVERNMPLVTVAARGYGVVAPVPAGLMFALYAKGPKARFSVANGPSGLECTMAPLAHTGTALDAPPGPDEAAGASPGTDTAAGSEGGPPAAGGEGGPPAAGSVGPQAVCLLPLDTQVYPGATVKLGIVAGEVTNVLRLPVTAVSGTAQAGEVTLLTGGTTHRAQVRLGASDGTFVEITSGLKAGDRVAALAPTFP